MLKWILVALPLTAQATCVIVDRTAVDSTAEIRQRSGLQTRTLPAPGLTGWSRCEVVFHAQIGDRWYLTQGHYDWPGDRPAAEACGIAQTRADAQARVLAGPSTIATHQTMICSDHPSAQQVQSAQIGQTAALHQFQPHPNFPQEFWHNGSRCRWFVEPHFRARDIHHYQGVICQLRQEAWVVVDKF